jgi:hypothetical protein
VTGGDRVGPVGDNPEAVEIAGDQERRILERERVALQLIDGVVEAATAALVLPAEAAALPDIRPALAAGGLADAFLEAVRLALGVGVGRLRLVQKLAQVIEMGVRGGSLLQVRRLPLRDEIFRCHGGASGSSSHIAMLQSRRLKGIGAAEHLLSRKA